MGWPRPSPLPILTGASSIWLPSVHAVRTGRGLVRVLFESDVVNAVCTELQARGYQIIQKLRTNEQGDDIIAVKQAAPVRELYVEAKGETSSRKGSRRYGKPFQGAQIRIHVGQAFYKAAAVLSTKGEGVEVRAGIALPNTKGHHSIVDKIAPVLNQLGIAVFWVQEGGEVQTVSPWQL